MILIIGGCASGKYTFAQTLGYRPEDFADGTLDEKPAIRHVEQLVSQSELSVPALFDALASKELILVAEVGCGPVPIDRKQSEDRERIGRLTTALAAQASQVYRMSCGIPVLIKG